MNLRASDANRGLQSVDVLAEEGSAVTVTGFSESDEGAGLRAEDQFKQVLAAFARYREQELFSRRT